MEKNKILSITLILFLIFILVYSVHLNYPFPLHIDEWHHITESIKLKQGEIPKGIEASETGFHFFLLFISLFTNIVLIYKFLPALWAITSALTLFFITKSNTSNLRKSFFISLFTIIFFASIKSNVNITGLWFFTPLTFSIPFIYLYIYFFNKGIQNQNKKYLLISLLIMIFLIPIHSISILFSIPFLIIYCFFNYKYFLKQYRFFLIFLLIPLIGILFYSFIINSSLINSLSSLIKNLQFKQGWGVLEIENSFSELYSPIAYFLAITGIISIFISKNHLKKYLIYILWPIILLTQIILFKITGKSYLSPYQRNLYYFILSLPFLSAFGLYKIIRLIKIQTHKIKSYKKTIFKIICIILIIIILSFTFKSYFIIPSQIKLYKTINNNDYQTLKFLSDFPQSKIITPIDISPAVFPISKHKPLATIHFYGNQKDNNKFFSSEKCKIKNKIIKKHKIKYVLSKKEINCNWTLIYNENNNFIYKI